MTIPLTLLNRFAVPFLVATLYLGNVNFQEQLTIMEDTMQKADAVLSRAKGEGEDPAKEVFDYVIVGSGSAGAIVANRLSASGEHSVLVLEAGTDPNPVTDVPYGQRFVWELGIMNWNFETVKQSRACLALDGICPWPRGKSLGGTSQINGLMYNRGMPQDYDSWAEFTGDDDWRWENVRESFNRLENYNGFYRNATDSGHGTTGEMYIGKIEHTPGVEVITEALRERNIPIGDLNTGQLANGFSRVDFNIRDGLRQGTYQAFLQPALERPNLRIYRYAFVTKVNFEGSRAVGVTYERHGRIQTAFARKEVILSAGAVGTPKLLLLSGIGPREHLEEVGIPVLVDLPVGQHLQEHPTMDIVGQSGGFQLNTTFGVDHNTTDALLQFLQNGTGSFNGFMFGSGFVSQIMWGNLPSSFNVNPQWPEVHVYVWETYAKPPEEKESMYFSLELLRSNTTGSIRLASSDPYDKPLIDPNFFADPTDLDRMIDVGNVMLDLFINTTAFQRVGVQMISPIDTCANFTFLSRDYWKCYMMHNTWPSFHPTSTCRMAPHPGLGVVDSSLRVFNTTGLRIIDASVFPFVPSGNTNMPSMLVGQRGAEIILGASTRRATA